MAAHHTYGTPRLDNRSFVVSTPGWERLTRQVESLLGAFHKSYPLRRGLSKEELRTRLGAEPRLFVRELETELSLSPELTDALLAQQRLVEVTAGLVYDPATLNELVERIRTEILREGPRTVAQIRDVLDASRKFTLALVNYTDEHKITRRVGDERVLY